MIKVIVFALAFSHSIVSGAKEVLRGKFCLIFVGNIIF